MEIFPKKVHTDETKFGRTTTLRNITSLFIPNFITIFLLVESLQNYFQKKSILEPQCGSLSLLTPYGIKNYTDM